MIATGRFVPTGSEKVTSMSTSSDLPGIRTNQH